MSKPKQPLLSLGAHGSLGSVLTFQERHQQAFVRKKPIPRQPNTLPQIYHRWDYQDYARLWHDLSAATKQQYESDARRSRITGFNLWMRNSLNDLPNLLGRWHLDEASGNIAYDSSKNANHGTIFGASPIDGLISLCRYFDGNDDYINIPHAPELEPTDQISIECFALPIADQILYTGIVNKGRPGYAGYMIYYANYFRGYIKGANGHSYTGQVPRSLGQWHHLVFTYDQTAGGIIYLNGIQNSTSPAQGKIDYSAYPGLPLKIAETFTFNRKFNGRIDEVRLYNRVLSPAEVLTHSERRYPQ